ncbi:MAG: PA14 domain-containing protein, partial [Abditibacteriaceae bacterium]
TNPFNGLDANQSTTGGNKSSGQQTPLPLGERAQRLAAGTALSNPAFSHSLTSNPAGGESADLAKRNLDQSAPRNRNNDLAGTNGAGEMHAPRMMANTGGHPRPSSNIMAYNDSTGRDHDRVAVAPGAFGPGNSGGTGAGHKRGVGAGRANAGFSRSPFNVRTGSGLGSGIGGSPWRGRGSGEAANGVGGAGVGGGTGLGAGVGKGGSQRGPRVAGNLFGGLTGSKGGGDKHGGGGTGGGPGGPGNGIQLGRQGGEGSGGSGKNGSGNGPSFGRGGLGAGTGAGTGIGKGNKGKGAGNKGNGRGDTIGDAASGKGIGGSHHPGMMNAKRKHGGGDIIGRGVWGSWTVKFYQDKSDHPDLPDANFGPGHAIDWPLFTDLKATKSYKTLDFDWGTTPPAVGMKDTFWSARITGKIFVPKDDDYWFYFDQLDDAGRLVLDGKQVINVWKVQKSTPDSGKIHLTRGEHDIVIEYVQGPGTEASLTLSWKSSSFPKEIVGAYKPGE